MGSFPVTLSARLSKNLTEPKRMEPNYAELFTRFLRISRRLGLTFVSYPRELHGWRGSRSECWLFPSCSASKGLFRYIPPNVIHQGRVTLDHSRD